jgi:hypothetical protein
MAEPKYELVRCEKCGKTLGYIYISARISYVGFMPARYWLLPTGQTSAKVEKVAYCESCFQQTHKKIPESTAEPQTEKNENVEPQSKSNDRSLVR